MLAILPTQALQDQSLGQQPDLGDGGGGGGGDDVARRSFESQQIVSIIQQSSD